MMDKCVNLICLCIFLCVVRFTTSKQIPSYLNLCSKHDPDLNACIMRAVEQIRPYLKDGIPELLIPSMNPMTIPSVSLNNGQSFNASFNQLQIFNAQNFQIKYLDANLEKNHLDLSLYFPSIRIDSVYKINGKLLFLELKGEGDCTGNYSDVYANSSVQGIREIKKGKEYIIFKDTNLNMKIGKVSMYFDKLFKDPELNKQINAVINENIDDFITELNPIIHESTSKIIFGLVGEIFSRFPLDTLFPDKIK